MLVTGGSGYLGGWVARLARREWDVTATFFLHPADEPPVAWRHLDVRDEAAVRSLVSRVRPDVVVHTAAERPGSEVDFAAVNGAGTRHVARAAAERGARLIHLSTDVVFDGEKGGYVEEDLPRPVHAYGRSKARAEEEVRQAGGEAVIIRTSLIYGWRPTIGRHTQWIIDGLAAGKTVRLFTDEFRNPIWVQSLASALVELAGSTVTGVLHVAGAQKLSRYDFGLRLLRFHGRDPAAVLPTSARALGLSRPLNCTLDCSRARVLLATPLPGVDEVLAAQSAG
jgi:dTDP-4-dehydrorhamnose reductase